MAMFWWKAQTEDGIEGWVAENINGIQTLTPIGSASSGTVVDNTENCAAGLTQLSVGSTASISDADPSPLPLHATPSAGGTLLAQIPVRTVLTIESGPTCAEGWVWWYISYKGQRGWVAEVDQRRLYNLILVEPPSTSSDDAPQNIENQIVGYWDRILSQEDRSSPGAYLLDMGLAFYSDGTVEISGYPYMSIGTYHFADANHIEAHVSTVHATVYEPYKETLTFYVAIVDGVLLFDDIQFEKVSDIPEMLTDIPRITGYRFASSIVYEQPSDYSQSLGALYNSEQYVVTGKDESDESNEWLQIEYDDAFAWVQKTESVRDNGLLFLAPTVPSNSHVHVPTGVGHLTLYEEPSTEATVLGTISDNAYYVLLDSSFGWVKIRSIQGDGWIESQNVRVQLIEPRGFRLDNTLSQAIDLIGADNLELMGATGKGQIVVVIDSGIKINHTFLDGKVVEEACYSHINKNLSTCPNSGNEEFQRGASLPTRCIQQLGQKHWICNHGTRVAGIIAGRFENLRGIAPDTSLISINASSFCTICDPPPLQVTLSNVMNALKWIEKHPKTYQISSIIISLEEKHLTTNTYCDSALPPIWDLAVWYYRDQIRRSVNHLRSSGVDVAVIAASGNTDPANGIPSATNGIAFPSCLRNVISVGASQVSDDQVATDFSKSAPILDLLAPGDDTLSNASDGILSPNLLQERFNEAGGTSFAAPFVAGAFAAIRSRIPDATVDEILEALQCTGPEIEDPRNGVKTSRIRVDTALGALLGEYVVPYGDIVALRFAERAIAEGCGVGGDTIRFVDPDTAALSIQEPVVDNTPFEPITAENRDCKIFCVNGVPV